MRLFGMGGQRLDAAVERERGAMPYPRLSGIRAVPYAPARSKTDISGSCPEPAIDGSEPGGLGG